MMALDPRPERDARWHMHMVLVAMMAFMALQLVIPTQTYVVNEHGDVVGNWRMIAKHLTEDQTAFIFATTALIGALGLFARRRWARMATAGVLSIVHGAVAATFICSNPGGIGSILLAGFAYQGYYLVARRARAGS